VQGQRFAEQIDDVAQRFAEALRAAV